MYADACELLVFGAPVPSCKPKNKPRNLWIPGFFFLKRLYLWTILVLYAKAFFDIMKENENWEVSI